MSERDHTDREHTDEMIATILREEADMASPGILPPLEDLQERAAARRRRPWLVAGGLAAAGVVGAVVWANLPGSDGTCHPRGMAGHSSAGPSLPRSRCRPTIGTRSRGATAHRSSACCP